MIFLKKIFMFLLIINCFSIFGISKKLEDAINKVDHRKVKKLLAERSQLRTTPFDMDAGNIADYLSIANNITNAADQQSQSLNNRSVKGRIMFGTMLVLVALYNLAGNILQNNVCASASTQGVALSSNSLSILGMGAWGIYNIYLGVTNSDANAKATSAQAIEKSLQDYLKTSSHSHNLTKLASTLPIEINKLAPSNPNPNPAKMEIV